MDTLNERLNGVVDRARQVYSDRNEHIDDALARTAAKRGYILLPQEDLPKLARWFELYRRSSDTTVEELNEMYEFARHLSVWPLS